MSCFAPHLTSAATADSLVLGHVFGKPTRKEFCYDNLRISRNAWDTNLVKVRQCLRFAIDNLG